MVHGSGEGKGRSRGTALLVEGGRVVVEGLPIRGVTVPIESSTHRGIVDTEVATDAALDGGEGGRGRGVLRDHVRAFMPTTVHESQTRRISRFD